MHAIVLAVVVSVASGCAPNVLTAKGKVMNPMVEDSRELAYTRKITIVRKDPAVKGRHIIVGGYGTPRALGELRETVEIPPQHSNGSGLFVTFELFSTHKDELAHLTENYAFWLILPDGRRIKGRFHHVWDLIDLTDKVTGGSMQTHQVVRDRSTGKTTQYGHWEEVENDFELYWRRVRVIFRGERIIGLKTPGIVLEVHGEQRVRRYVVEFTNDPMELMDEEEKAIFLEDEKLNGSE